MSIQKTAIWLAVLLYAVSVLYVSYIPTQSDFGHIIIPYSIGFSAYYYLITKGTQSFRVKHFIGLAIILRILILPSFPNLSDDVYRFIWDGRCLHNGISPFAHLPTEIVGQYEGLSEELLSKMNSPSYFSIYPPIGQLIAYLAGFTPSIDYYNEVIVFKVFILFAEIGSLIFGIKILEHLNLNKERILIYALNPLVIIELMGNIHFEAYMIFFLVLGILFFLKQGFAEAALSLAAGVASKLLPLMFIPLFMANLKKINIALLFLTILALTTLGLFTSVLSLADVSNIITSVDLYVKKFEFNGSIYYALRYFGYWIKGFNVIHIVGPLLSVFTVVVICLQAIYFFRSKLSRAYLPLFLLLAFSSYLLMATTVHPWYIATPLMLCMFTSYRFPVLWSFLIMFTYINYSYAEYDENLQFVMIEYIVLYGFIIWEVKQKGIKAENEGIIDSSQE